MGLIVLLLQGGSSAVCEEICVISQPVSATTVEKKYIKREVEAQIGCGVRQRGAGWCDG